MRDFFINWAEKLVGVLIGLIVIGSIGMGGFMMMMPAVNGGGVLTGLLFIVGGALYAIVVGGMLYLFFGIYRNTQITNELLEMLVRK
mgnify:CR=1 FL=1